MLTLCLKYNKVPQPYAKHSDNMTNGLNLLKLYFKKILSHRICGW